MPTNRSHPRSSTVVRLCCASSLLLAVGCSDASLTGTPAGAALAELPCSHLLERQLAEWRVTGDVLEGAGGQGFRQLRMPTDRLGVWAVVQIRDLGDIQLEVRSADPPRTQAIRVDDECRLRRAAEPAVWDGGASGGLSDAVLGDLVEAALADGTHGGLLVYVWSPHMPLSVDGWAEISAAAAEAGLRLVPALVAGSDADFAMREAVRVGMPTDAVREVASLELMMRDAQVHAPALLVFGPDGVSPVLPGYRHREGYRDFVSAFLNGPVEDPGDRASPGSGSRR